MCRLILDKQVKLSHHSYGDIMKEAERISTKEKFTEKHIPLVTDTGSKKTDNNRIFTSFNIKITIAVLLFLIGIVFAIWYFQSELLRTIGGTDQVLLPTRIPAKVVIVGTDPTYPPMEYIEDGKMTGYDIDIAVHVLNELGMRSEFKNILFDDLFSALEQKQIDMIISTVTINEERKQKYDFSDPYLNAGQVIITRKDTADIVSTADLNGKKIGVQTGTTIETEALKYTEDQLVVRYTDFDETIQALINGDVHAIFTDLPNAKGLVLQNPELKIASDPFTDDYYGIVFRKGDPLVKRVNSALESLRIKGVLADLKQKWLD